MDLLPNLQNKVMSFPLTYVIRVGSLRRKHMQLSINSTFFEVGEILILNIFPLQTSFMSFWDALGRESHISSYSSTSRKWI